MTRNPITMSPDRAVSTENYLIAIDDEPGLLTIISRAAEELGFRVAATGDPEAFKALVRDGHPTVVVLDLHMPGCDGIELLRFLSEQECQAHVVLVSGVDQRLLSIAKNVGDGLSLKMAEPFQKPLRLSALRPVLQNFRQAASAVDATLLRHGLENGQLTLAYQPLIDLRETRLVGWEALVRWHHPELGLIMPDRFIPIAEKEGLIDFLTDRVLNLAVAQIAEGVETADLAARLTAEGCEIGQGYHFAKPMFAADIPGWCAANTKFTAL